MSSSFTPSSLSPLARLQRYSSEPYPSQDQIKLAFGPHAECVDPSQWKDVSFTEEFYTKYGKAFGHYRIFQRAMQAQPDRCLLSKFKHQIDFYELASKYSFVAFCKSSDHMAEQKRMAPLGRVELEAAWIQEVLYKYDVMDIQAVALKWHLKGDVDGKLKFLLKQTIDKRFTSSRVEEYWVEKKNAFPGYDFDITMLKDNADEPASEEEKKKASESKDDPTLMSMSHGDEIDNDSIWGEESDYGNEDAMNVDVEVENGVEMGGDFGNLTHRPKYA